MSAVPLARTPVQLKNSSGREIGNPVRFEPDESQSSELFRFYAAYDAVTGKRCNKNLVRFIPTHGGFWMVEQGKSSDNRLNAAAWTWERCQ